MGHGTPSNKVLIMEECALRDLIVSSLRKAEALRFMQSVIVNVWCRVPYRHDFYSSETATDYFTEMLADKRAKTRKRQVNARARNESLRYRKFSRELDMSVFGSITETTYKF